MSNRIVGAWRAACVSRRVLQLEFLDRTRRFRPAKRSRAAANECRQALPAPARSAEPQTRRARESKEATRPGCDRRMNTKDRSNRSGARAETLPTVAELLLRYIRPAKADKW